MKTRRLLSSILAIVMILGIGTTNAYANSAQSQWTGVDSTGAIVTDENCPIIVEHELLTFDIAEFPLTYYSEKEAYLSYSGMVTAQYTFYNPADYTVTAKLVFPFGPMPSYGYDKYDEELDKIDYADNTAKFDVSVDGETIEKTLRHTLFYRYDQFELQEDLGQLQDNFAEDDFFFPELTVTKYTFKANVNEDLGNAVTVATDIPSYDGTRKVLFVEQDGGHTQDNGDVRIGASANYHEIFTLYVFGEPYDAVPEWKFYKDGGVENGEEVDGSMNLLSEETMTFREFANSVHSSENGISEIDWYNGLVADFNQSDWENAGFVSCSEYNLDITNSFMRWYEYEITLEPGQRIVNTVEAPIYPSIDIDYEPNVYGYTYLLSPAQTWSEFGELEIVIHTPYFIVESNLDGFEKNDTGYTLKLNGLPEGELEFILCESETVQSPQKSVSDYIPVEMIISFTLIGIAAVLVTVCVVVFIRRKRNKG